MPLLNASGGHVHGSMARPWRRCAGSVSPLKTCRNPMGSSYLHVMEMLLSAERKLADASPDSSLARSVSVTSYSVLPRGLG